LAQARWFERSFVTDQACKDQPVSHIAMTSSASSATSSSVVSSPRMEIGVEVPETTPASPITVRARLALSGEELEPIRLSTTDTVERLREQVMRQLPDRRFTLKFAGHTLPITAQIGSHLEDDSEVMVIVLSQFLLKQIDDETGLPTPMLRGACWIGTSLHLKSEGACARTGWDIVPDVGQRSFAVEATVKLADWPYPDWQGTIVSQHGHGTGWELRCGGAGVNVVFTTTNGGHNELMLSMRPEVNSWVHFCMSFNVETQTLRVFRNGCESAEKTIRGRFRPFRDGCVVVGRNPEWPERGILGQIRDVIVWRDGLDEELLPRTARDRLAEAEAAEERERHPEVL